MRLLIESQRSWEFGWEIPRIAWCHNGNYVWLVLVTIQIRTERITTTTTTSTTKQPSSGLSQWEIPFHRFWWYNWIWKIFRWSSFRLGEFSQYTYDMTTLKNTDAKWLSCKIALTFFCFRKILRRFPQDVSCTHTYTPSRRDLCHTSPKVPTERLNAVTVEV